ncbi:hypothetical protein QGP82_09940 [Leptothoe sp. LEGE 181152]|uniref:hypothetical protein n=1 Tax=Adonisia turfae TaxID=2950184 RepID=UPI0020299D2B|nr:hypothetical protein [Adonisia turfae]MDV3349011.1 hypothetical protein [Leptothoe sp. LEGE 181152]
MSTLLRMFLNYALECGEIENDRRFGLGRRHRGHGSYTCERVGGAGQRGQGESD